MHGAEASAKEGFGYISAV